MAEKTKPSMNTAGQATKETNKTACNTASGDTNADSSKAAYRTRQKAGDTAETPTRLPVITNSKYQSALTLSPNGNAYLQPLSNIAGIKYKNGVLYFEGVPATSEKLSALYTLENIEETNLPLLRALYGIIFTKISDTLSTDQSIDEVITVYFPEFSRRIGKSANIGITDLNKCMDYIRHFQTIVGIIDKGTKGSDILPVLINIKYNKPKNIISFHSPYMIRIIKDIYELSIRKDKNGQALLKKNGEQQMLPSHSYLIDMSIAKERNKRAVEIVIIVVVLIEQAGNNTPHIRAKTIVERNTLLHKALDKQSAGNRNNLLKRAFSKAWELLREKTSLSEVYENIQLPDPNDAAAIPTSASLDMVFKFPHDGKNNKV